MLNIEKLKALAEKKHLNLRTLCLNAVAGYGVMLDKIRKGNELTVTESEKLTSELKKIVADITEAIQ